MNAGLIRERDAAFERYDQALTRWPKRTGDDFVRETTAVVIEMERIAAEADAADGDRVERARTWRYAGDACVDRAADEDLTWLARARSDYQQAEERLEGLEEPLQRGRLDFNIASLLKLLSRGRDRRLLAEADRRMSLALVAFQKDEPELAQRASDALSLIKAQDVRAAQLGFAIEGEVRLDPMEQAFDTPAVREMNERAKEIAADLIRYGVGPATDENVAASVNSRAPDSNNDGVAEFREEFSAIRAQFDEDVRAGRLTPERRQALEPLLDELAGILDERGDVLTDSMSRAARVRALMQRLTTRWKTPSGAAAADTGERTPWLLQQLGSLGAFVSNETLSSNVGHAVRGVGVTLFNRITSARLALDSATDANAVRAIEREVIRQIALDVEAFALRQHLMLAQPHWAAPSEPANPNNVYFSGAAKMRESVSAACRARGLSLARTPRDAEPGQARWEALWSSRLAVVDMSPPPGPELAAAAYDVGLAKSLGRRCVIVHSGAPLPFDVEFPPVQLAQGADGVEEIGRALDEALYAVASRRPDSSVAATVAWIARRCANDPLPAGVRHTVKLVAEAADDPEEVRRRIETLLGFLGPEPPRMLQPAWPGGYPRPGVKRLFHVMPFSARWSTAARDAVAGACRGVAEYARGDEVSDPHIVRSIWDEICRASHVLVDLTDFNANVALELGLAHGLGRHCCVVGQTGTVERLFPALSKLRVLPYEPTDGDGGLRSHVETFLGSAGTP